MLQEDLMNVMMKERRYSWVLLALASCFLLQTSIAGETNRSVLDFGVRVIKGEIQYPLPANVSIGFLDRDDIADAVVFEHDTVEVYQGLGCGQYRLLWQRRFSRVPEYTRFTDRTRRNGGCGDLLLHYADGSDELVLYDEIQARPVHLDNIPSVLSPPPTFDFQLKWRDGPIRPSGTDGPLVGDIDNDGRTEIVYLYFAATFGDSIDTLVVYEHLGNHTYRVEWDTLIYRANGIYGLTDVDNNGKKEILFGSDEHDYGHTGTIRLLECHGEGNFRLYATNLGYGYGGLGSPREILEADIDQAGAHELITHLHRYDGSTVENFISVCWFAGIGVGQNGWLMAFGPQEVYRSWQLWPLASVGQLDGAGDEEIVLSSTGALPGYAEPIHYLKHDPQQPGIPWVLRQIETGLASSFGQGVFLDMDGDGSKEIVMSSGGPWPLSSIAALKHIQDTVWTVLWVDSTSWRGAPRGVDTARLQGIASIVFIGSNGGYGIDTAKLRLYSYSGDVFGYWKKDSTELFDFHLLDIDADGKLDIICTYYVSRTGSYLANLEQPSSVTVSDVVTMIARDPLLEQNFPNPFNSTTTMTYYLPREGHATLKVFDILGRELVTLVDQTEPAGFHAARWLPDGFPSGTYFFRLEFSDIRLVRKLLFIK
jgi:hypothetical protein